MSRNQHEQKARKEVENYIAYPAEDNEDIIFFGSDTRNIPIVDWNKLMNYENPVLGLIIILNLNPKLPIYHNIYYEDIDSDVCEIYTKENWKKESIEDVLDKLIDAKLITFKHILKVMGPRLSTKLKEFISDGIDFIECASRRKLRTFRNEIKQALYDNRHAIRETKKFFEKENNKIFNELADKIESIDYLLQELCDISIPRRNYRTAYCACYNGIASTT